ncbi:unnamed protein product [Closterium sp. NIES-65]|nr:unnamed protein product [Closterium sp. NIES-65]
MPSLAVSGETAGIVVGGVFALIFLLLLLAVWVYCTRKTKAEKKEHVGKDEQDVEAGKAGAETGDMDTETGEAGTAEEMAAAAVAAAAVRQEEATAAVAEAHPAVCRQYSLAEVGGSDGAWQVNEMATKNHPNLVRLLGYCFDMNHTTERIEQIVIYEFMSNGDLERWIGPRVGDMNRHGLCAQVAPLVAAGDVSAFKDPLLQAPDDLVLRMAKLSISCTVMPTASRPSMNRILTDLTEMKDEFLGAESNRMAEKIDRELESSSAEIDFAKELARAQGMNSSDGLSSCK